MLHIQIDQILKLKFDRTSGSSNVEFYDRSEKQEV